MDWQNESWVKLYTRNTAELVVIGWEARALLWELMRVCDGAGFVDTADPEEIAVLCHMPSQVVTRGHAVLLERGIVEPAQNGTLITNFLEAQQARTSDKERKRKSREKQRASKKRVTDSHAESHEVTRGHSASGIEENRREERERVEGPTRALVDELWSTQNQHRADLGLNSLGIMPPAEVGAEILKRIEEQGGVENGRKAGLHVLAVVASEAAANPEKAQFLDGRLWKAERFLRSLANTVTKPKHQPPKLEPFTPLGDTPQHILDSIDET